MSIAVLDGGTYYHAASIGDPRFRGYFDTVLPLQDLADCPLSDHAALVLPDRTHPARLRAHRVQILDYLAAGGFLIVFGESEAESWLPDVAATAVPTNFWWWLKAGADIGFTVASPGHGLFRYLTREDCIWHYHMVYAPPCDATPLLLDRDGRAVLYEQEMETGGRLMLSGLDPFYHHGSNFMPATTRFLTGFLPWLRETVHPC